MKEVVSKIKKVTTGFANSTEQTIIIGGNEVSVQLAERLIQTGQDIVIIEEDDLSRKQVQERVDVLAINGKGTDIATLKQAGIAETDLLIAITNDDHQNLLAGIYAQKLGVDNIIVQVREKKNLDYKLQTENLKLNLVVNPFAGVVKRIKGLIKPGMELAVDNLLDKRVQISQFRISHQSNFAYNAVSKINLPDNSLLLAILRKGRAIIPQGRDKVYPGDRLFIINQKGFKGKLGKLVSQYPDDKEKIVLVGGGEINYQLAKHFAKESTVTIVDNDLKRCENLADKLNDVLVLQGKGTDIDLLKEEGVAKADAFIAVTEDDEANLLMANLAKKLGVKNSVAIVTDINYSYLTDFLDIDHIISPSAITVDSILDYFYQGQVESNTIFDGQVKVSEITIKQKRSTKIKDLKLPSDLIIGLIKRGKKIIIPQGETKLENQDKLLVFSLVAKGDIRGYF